MELSDTDDSMRWRSRKIAILGESARRQFESPRERSYGFMGDLNYMQEDDIELEATLSRLSNIFKKHGDLAERMSRDSDKSIFERLSKEFEAARALQTQEIYLEGEQWNDGLLATIRERVHMEVERKAMARDAGMLHSPHLQERITYRVGDKVICCLEGSRIGILYEPSYAGEPCDIYHLVLESKSFLEKMTVLEHTIPFFLPLNEAENDLLSSNAVANFAPCIVLYCLILLPGLKLYPGYYACRDLSIMLESFCRLMWTERNRFGSSRGYMGTRLKNFIAA